MGFRKKGLLSLALCALLVGAIGSLAFAESGPGEIRSTASVDLSGSGSTTWNIDIKNYATNGSTAAITWTGDVQGIAPLTAASPPGWVIAEQYIEVTEAPSAYPGWVMQLYTDNKDPAASPKYEGTKEGVYSLVGVTNSSASITMCWKVTGSTEPYNPTGGVDPLDTPVWLQDRGDGTDGFTDYSWKWLKDESQADFRDGSDFKYISITGNDGIYWHEADGNPGPSPAGSPAPCYIYLSADFAPGVTTAQPYATNMLTIELLTL
jgi:hypothetical protein